MNYSAVGGSSAVRLVKWKILALACDLGFFFNERGEVGAIVMW